MKNATPFSEARPVREAQPDTDAPRDRQTLVVGEDDTGRLDAWLAAALEPDLSRSRIKALIEAGAVTVNGTPAKQAKQKIQPGDRVELTVPEAEDADPAAGQPAEPAECEPEAQVEEQEPALAASF